MQINPIFWYTSKKFLWYNELDSKPNLLEKFDIDICSYLIEKAIVNQDGSVTFVFNNGKIKI